MERGRFKKLPAKQLNLSRDVMFEAVGGALPSWRASAPPAPPVLRSRGQDLRAKPPMPDREDRDRKKR